ncbi:transglycosylase SLT domain-containing protein [Aminobacter niigataensis]|nr:transglycosylase SLT domain-containing protein [Aminobacter niigataensis]
MKIIAQIESGGNPRAKNPRSSAGGPFQFIDSTAKAMGLADRYDVDQASDAAARLMKGNAGHLRKVLGRDPTPGELYLAHQQGAGGAAKLLANPDAKASSVVGADAVRLNGGRAGMTAGQFARLWINKAENGYVLPSEPDQISPGVTLTGGTYRPSGRDTIFGRAYDEAGTRTYVQMLETEMRSTSSQLFDRYKDDPVKLAEAFNDLKGAIAKDHVFPEIMSDYEIGFGNMAERYVGQARDNLAKKAEAQDRADFIERTGTLETEQKKRLADFDPSSPDAADAIAASQAAIDDHYDSAVTRGVLDPDDAARAKIASRREAALGFYGKQADTLDADGVAAMRKEMAADFAAGQVEGMDGDGWQTLDLDLQKLETFKRNEAERTTGSYRKRGDQLAERIAAGYDLDPAELSKFMLDAGRTPEGKTAMQESLAKITAARAIRGLPVPDGEAYVAKLRTEIGRNPTDEQISVLNYAEKSIAARKKAIEVDPLGEANRDGTISLTPIDATSDDALAATLTQRREQAQRAAAHHGIAVPSLYRPEEKKLLTADMASLDPKRYGNAMKQLDFIATSGGFAEVAAQFGNDGIEKLQDWQGRLRYSTPEEVQSWLKDRANPKWQENIKPLVSKGETEARKRTFEQIVADLDANWIFDTEAPIDADTRRMLVTDFVGLAGQRYAVTGDAGTAREQAIEQMRRIWGTTSVNGSRGGRLMAYPPEQYYPTVGADKAWLAEEWREFTSSRNLDVANTALVPDGKTKTAADSGQAPGYLIAVTDPETGLDELLSDEKGRPLRYFFDPLAAQKQAMERAAVARKTQHDPWIVINEGTTIGPFYPPWRPATPADMQMRAERVREILDETEQRHEEHRRVREQLRQNGLPGER